MTRDIPSGSMTADPVFIAKVKLFGEQLTLLCNAIETGPIPPAHLSKQLITQWQQLNAELDGVGASVPGVNR